MLTRRSVARQGMEWHCGAVLGWAARGAASLGKGMFVALGALGGFDSRRHNSPQGKAGRGTAWHGPVGPGTAGRGGAGQGEALRGKERQCKGKFVVMVAGWFDSTRHN